jgi:hypothetical protein
MRGQHAGAAHTDLDMVVIVGALWVLLAAVIIRLVGSGSRSEPAGAKASSRLPGPDRHVGRLKGCVHDSVRSSRTAPGFTAPCSRASATGP